MKETLTILVPSVLSRFDTFGGDTIRELQRQYNLLDADDQRRVHVMVWIDNKIMPIGEKRQVMLKSTRSDYMAFVDDDDRIDPTYIYSLLRAIDASNAADVIVFDVMVSINGMTPRPCYYSISYPKDHNAPTHYERLPNHLMCVRTSKARIVGFDSFLSKGEDSDYAKRLRPFLETEYSVGRTLYYYDFNSETTETQR